LPDGLTRPESTPRSPRTLLAGEERLTTAAHRAMAQSTA
jgi:hypothetical protein